MDIWSVVGTSMGMLAVFGGAILEGLHVGQISQGTAAIIVFGGTFGAMFLSFPPQDVKRAFGLFPLIYKKVDMDVRPVIDEIVRTASSLAGKKIGAIIVLERETKLSEYVDSGVPIDATLSRRLLESIFYPSSPLHDGAVVIQGGRIAAASCYLPLTLTPDVSEELGTRHRAAIGLTEETDAIVIVVSEETGSVSLVRGGIISQGLDATALRRLLGELLEPPRGGASGARLRGAVAPSSTA